MPLRHILSQMIGRAVEQIPLEDPRVNRAVGWINVMQQHAFGVWSHVAEQGVHCGVGVDPGAGVTIGCGSPAIGACVGCGGPVCFAHAFVDGRSGAAMCHGCVHIQIKAAGGSDPGREVPPPRRPVNDDEAERRKLRKKHLKRLGIRCQSVTLAELQAAYRKRAALVHPDHAKSEADRKKRHKRMVMLNESRDWLVADLERQERAA